MEQQLPGGGKNFSSAEEGKQQQRWCLFHLGHLAGKLQVCSGQAAGMGRYLAAAVQKNTAMGRGVPMAWEGNQIGWGRVGKFV